MMMAFLIKTVFILGTCIVQSVAYADNQQALEQLKILQNRFDNNQGQKPMRRVLVKQLKLIRPQHQHLF